MSEPVVHVHETPLHFLGINYAEKPELYLFLFAIFKFLPKKNFNSSVSVELLGSSHPMSTFYGSLFCPKVQGHDVHLEEELFDD